MYINLAYIEAITYFKPKNLITSRTTAVKFAKIYLISDSITSYACFTKDLSTIPSHWTYLASLLL